MQEYVIDLYRHFLFRFFWAMSKVMYLVILLSFCYLTEDYMAFAYFAVLCNIDKRICSIIIALIFYNGLHLQLVRYLFLLIDHI